MPIADLFLHILLGFPLGLLAENAGEWLMHRYILHRLGRRPGSLWNYHLNEHHLVCRQNGMIDPGYEKLPLRWNTQGKEAVFLLLVVLFHVPLWRMFPGYVAGMYFALGFYYYKHRKSHLDPAWARSQLGWHYRHHMGDNMEADWCITWNWFDRLMKTEGS